MKLSEFINQQASKAGITIDMNVEANKAFFDAAAAMTVEIPDDVAKSIDNKFITVEAAKNNHPDIKNYYQSQALDTIDKSTIATLKELGVPQDTIDALIKEEGSTFKRVPLVLKKIQELEKTKANANKPDQQAIQKQIDDLQNSLRLEKDITARTIKEKEDFEKGMRLRYKRNSIFATAKTTYDNLDPEEKYGALDIVLDRALNDSNAKMDLDEHGNITLTRKDGTTYFGDNNVPVNPQQFVDGLLSRKKLLVSNQSTAGNNNGGTPPAGNSANNGSNNAPPSGNGGSGNAKAPSTLYNEHTKQALADLKESAGVM